MKLLHRNATIQLFEKAKELDAKPHDSWRCVYFNLAHQHGTYKTDLVMNFIVNPIARLLEDMDGYIYLCNDGDLFILFQGPVRPVINKLEYHFGNIDMTQALEDYQQHLYSVIDLGRYWELFYSLCEAKARQIIRPDVAMLRGYAHNRAVEELAQ
ncbi:MAG: hypothetical protein SFT92_09900 [Rickettsiales bacterium]|nr:hypothetical protein [Rickettsiales bacterium]